MYKRKEYTCFDCFSALSSASNDFSAAQTNLKKLREEPDSSVKLQLYALFKQVRFILKSPNEVADFEGFKRRCVWKATGRVGFRRQSQIRCVGGDQRNIAGFINLFATATVVYCWRSFRMKP